MLSGRCFQINIIKAFYVQSTKRKATAKCCSSTSGRCSRICCRLAAGTFVSGGYASRLECDSTYEYGRDEKAGVVLQKL